MELYVDFDGSTLIFRLIGELDEHSAEFVKRKLDEKLANSDYSAVVLDLSRLSFMDSTGIGVIIGRYKIVRKQNKRMYVKNPSPTVDKIFNMSGLYEIISKI